MAKRTFVLVKDEEKKHSVKYASEQFGTQYIPKDQLREEGVQGYPEKINVTMEW